MLSGIARMIYYDSLLDTEVICKSGNPTLATNHIQLACTRSCYRLGGHCVFSTQWAPESIVTDMTNGTNDSVCQLRSPLRDGYQD